ncbi:MAG: hypothetical protein V4480_03220 [Patescibacteria group bacterium]
MTERLEKSTNDAEAHKPPKTRVFVIRHSRATYRSYGEKLMSDSPESPMDINAQSPDLSEAGIDMAKEKAREFFSRFDPKLDAFFIVSSTQMRALETGRIYADIARELGFEVIEHEKTGSKVAAEVGESSLRSINALSLNMENQVLGSIFNSPYDPEVNWDAVRPETKALFDRARAIVKADDRGSWGANFAAHAEKVREFIPDMETPAQLHETQFKNMQRLAQWARSKAPEDKRVNVIGFGHENYMGHALEEHTGNHALGNVEAVELLEDETAARF